MTARKFSKRGFSLIESLILIIVVSLTLGALLQTAAYSTRMQMTGRRYVDTHAVGVSWFAVLDTYMTSADVPGAILSADREFGDSSAYIGAKSWDQTLSDITVEITLIGENNARPKMRKVYNIYGN